MKFSSTSPSTLLLRFSLLSYPIIKGLEDIRRMWDLLAKIGSKEVNVCKDKNRFKRL